MTYLEAVKCLVLTYYYTSVLVFLNSRILETLSRVFICASVVSEGRQKHRNQNAVSLAMQTLCSFVCSIYEATCRTDN